MEEIFDDPISAIAAIVAIISVYVTLATNFYLKSQDILSKFFERYFELEDRKLTINVMKSGKAKKKSAKAYYQNYWDFQYEEFVFWRRGFIQNTTYRTWLIRRKFEYKDPNNSIGGKSYKKGWKSAKKVYKGTFFKRFYDDLFDEKKQPKELIRKYRPHYYNRLFPKLFSLREFTEPITWWETIRDKTWKKRERIRLFYIVMRKKRSLFWKIKKKKNKLWF